MDGGLETFCNCAMIKVSKKDVPHFLRNSALYRAFGGDSECGPGGDDDIYGSNSNYDGSRDGNVNERDGDAGDDDDEVIEFPERNMKTDLQFECPDDMKHMLATLHFWGCDEMPQEMSTYCLAFAPPQLARDPAHMSSVRVRASERRGKSNSAASNSSAPSTKRKRATPKAISAPDGPSPPSSNSISAAIASLLLEYKEQLDYVKTLYYVFTARSPKSRCCRAAESGSVQMMSSLLSLHPAPVQLDTPAARTRSRRCHAEHSQSVPIGAAGAASEVTSTFSSPIWSTVVTEVATIYGQLACLRFAHEKGCPWSSTLIASALGLCFIPIHPTRRNSCLLYAIENGCPLPEYIYWHGDCPRLLCSALAQLGLSNCIAAARKRGAEWSELTCKWAVAAGELKCLQFLHEHGCPWDAHTTAVAASNGDLACLKYAHEHGCEWNKDVCFNAAYHGHLECLQYLHTNDCPWDEETCHAAAGTGQLECLRYAHEQGCPWDESTCDMAADGSHLSTLQYAHEHGCPWSESTSMTALGRGDSAIMIYLVENNCPGIMVMMMLHGAIASAMGVGLGLFAHDDDDDIDMD